MAVSDEYKTMTEQAFQRANFYRSLYARYNPDFALKHGLQAPGMEGSAEAVNSLIATQAGKLAGRGGTGSAYRVAEGGIARRERAGSRRAEFEQRDKMGAFFDNAQGGVRKQVGDMDRLLGMGRTEDEANYDLRMSGLGVRSAKEAADKAIAENKKSGMEAFMAGIGGKAGDVAGYYVGKKLFKSPYDEEDEQ